MPEKPTYEEMKLRIQELEKTEFELKSSQKALQESEDRYRSVVEDMPVLICSFLPSGEITFVNRTYCEYFDKTSEALIGSNFLSLIPEVDQQAVMDNIYALTVESPTQSHEHAVIAPTGDARWQRWTNRALFNAQGKAVGYQSIGEDITEYKRIEEVLRENEEKYRTLVEGIPDLIYSYSTIRGGIYYSPNVKSVLGYSESQLLQNPQLWHNSIHPEDVHRVDAVIKDFQYGKPFEIEYRIKDTKGNWLWFLDRSIGRKKESGEVVIEGIATDITARKHAENLLRKSEEKYRFLADNITDALWILDIDKLKLIYVSPSIERIQGYTPEELMEIPLNENLTSQSFELIAELISAELKKEETGRADPLRSRTVEIEVYCKDGSAKWLEITAGFIRDEKNRVNGIIGVTRDISERKYAEEERKNLEMQLQQAQKMEAIGTLAGGVAHDFNNILSAVYGYTELALGDAKKGTMQYENLQDVLRAGNRAKELVKQILTFSRQVDHEQKPVQVKLIVKEALKLLRASIPSTIEIDQNVKSDALVMGNSTQIHQIIINLCTNAAHAMEEKGGVLTVSLSDAELDSEFISNDPELKPGPYINLTVNDTGHGMSPYVLKQIFDPFFTTKEKGSGTGMGLSVVHGIVSSYEGTISVNSEPGKGSSFKVFLPIIERRLKPEGRIEKPIPTGTERILFIDDEPAIVNMGKQILASLGYDVVTRTSSIEALELFRIHKGRFDLVITDMTMPQMTGENLARELFRIRPDVPVILCTGFSARMEEKKARALGIQAFISKPILKRKIAEAIRAVLDGK